MEPCLNGIEVNKKGQGVQNRDQLDLLIERAAQESPLTIPSIRELNERNPNLKEEESLRRLKAERDLMGPNWNHRHIHPWTYGEDIGVLEITSITGEEYVGNGNGLKDLYKYPLDYEVGKRSQNPQWLIDMSKRFNAALRRSVVCVKDKRGYPGLPCHNAGCVNVEALLKYDDLWRDQEVLAGSKTPDFDIIVKRWDLFQLIIFTEYKQTHRVRAQVLGLKVTKGS